MTTQKTCPSQIKAAVGSQIEFQYILISPASNNIAMTIGIDISLT